MIVTTRAHILKGYLDEAGKAGKRTGFVPTMGALHKGHISLIERSRNNCDLTLASIFVNPTQFNNADDLLKYPRTTEKDIDMLEASGCDILFLPPPEEIYPPGFRAEHYELGMLDTILEGAFRPGHFQGVCMVVDRLLSFTRPDCLYLGQKDYQQCMVIGKMIRIKNHKTEIIVCPTIREEDGLAMSSRNMRLSKEERTKAVEIFNTLLYLKENIKPGDISHLKRQAEERLVKAGFRVEYAEVADAEDLSAVEKWNGTQKLVGLIAAFPGDVRLIDNILLN